MAEQMTRLQREISSLQRKSEKARAGMDSNPKPERLIVKPPGAAGKRNGYQVREAMGLGNDKQQYNALMAATRQCCRQYLEIDKTRRGQDDNEIALVVMKTHPVKGKAATRQCCRQYLDLDKTRRGQDENEIALVVMKAQTLDPDHTLAWIGRALTATAKAREVDARIVLPMADPAVYVAFHVHAALNNSISVGAPTTDRLLPAFFVLGRYFQRCSADVCGLHVFGLICDHLGKLEQGSEYINRAITLLEAAYEEKEDPIVERQFVIAHTNIARLRLGLQDYEGSLASFEIALGLLPEDTDASFKMGDLQVAMTAFQATSESAADDRVLRGQVTVLLAQTMWAIGTPEFREFAKGLLLGWSEFNHHFRSRKFDGDQYSSWNGKFTEDDGLVDAALSEILSLPVEQRQVLNPRRDVKYLLVQYYLGLGDYDRATKISQEAVHVEPSNLQVRREVASLLLKHRERRCIGHPGIALAQPIQSQRSAQKAIMLEPGQLRNWQTLAYVRAHEAL
ncbi:hypothetical protein BD769DRAFT_1693390 [Suillus cothurnatus]|nr:hypothetical protein BD769DRAFT_1693390 [Suillus cothurnatus]